MNRNQSKTADTGKTLHMVLSRHRAAEMGNQNTGGRDRHQTKEDLASSKGSGQNPSCNRREPAPRIDEEQEGERRYSLARWIERKQGMGERKASERTSHEANVILQTKRKKKKNKTKQNYPEFKFKPRRVNDSSQSNQGTDHLVSQFLFKTLNLDET
jgi:hypothetical protein